MGLIGELRRRARHVVGPFLGIVVVAYFAYHTVHGDRGVLAYLKMLERVAKAEAKLEELKAEHAVWDRRVKLLHPENLDPDMLDERVRLMLGYAQADDIVVFLDRNEKLN